MVRTPRNRRCRSQRNPHDPGAAGGRAAARGGGGGGRNRSLRSVRHGRLDPPAGFILRRVGKKPTYGRVSRYGLVAMARRSIRSAHGAHVAGPALLLSVIAAHGPDDSTSSRRPRWIRLRAGGGRRRGAACRRARANISARGWAPRLRAAVESAIAKLEASGCEILPLCCRTRNTRWLLTIFRVFRASSNLARYDGVLYGFRAQGAKILWDLYKRTRTEGFGAESSGAACSETTTRVRNSTTPSTEGFACEGADRARFCRGVQRSSDLSPSRRRPPTASGEKVDDPALLDLATSTANGESGGAAAISVPCGKTAAGLPSARNDRAAHGGNARAARRGPARSAAGPELTRGVFPFTEKKSSWRRKVSQNTQTGFEWRNIFGRNNRCVPSDPPIPQPARPRPARRLRAGWLEAFAGQIFTSEYDWFR
jgi:aspartyl-tRNA(Asn)/glutamyl-tRNA(Gln) amidotransferase subunit A